MSEEDRLSPLDAYDLLAAHASPAVRGKLLAAALRETLTRRLPAAVVSDLYSPDEAPAPPPLATVVELPRFDRLSARAASGRHQQEPAAARSEVAPGLTCTERDVDDRQVEIVVEAAEPSWSEGLLHLWVADTGVPEAAVPYVLVLHDSHANGAEGSLTVPASAAVSVSLTTEPADLVTLNDVPPDVVARSVRACTTPADRNAWRAAARARPDGDPVREAIVASLP